MRKLEGAVIHMNKNEIRYLVGSEELQIRPLPIYSDIVCEFFDDLSKRLRCDSEAKNYPDILTFAFWCRKGNIISLKNAYASSMTRMGKGLVFHVAPSNVPINFAFTLAFGLLAGNGNVVRVSEKEFPQTEIVCRILRELLKQPKYEILAKQIQVVSYGHNKEVNDYYSEKCDMRVIWGGDVAIGEIRKSPLKPRATDITFSDRYSFAVFDELEVKNISEKELINLAEKFYNDTYLMDQNACSSPHLVLWQNAMPDMAGRKRFWNALYNVTNKYDLPEKKVLDKYTILCEKVAQMQEIKSVHRYANLLYVVNLSCIPDSIVDLRGKFGLFFEMELKATSEIFGKLSEKVQTCVTYGVDRKELLHKFQENYVLGVDRIVSVGQAMDIGVYWDGYDVIGSLSRGIYMA